MYNTDYSISQQYDPFEEERKRREQELLASQQLSLPVQGAISPDQLGQVPEIGQLPTFGEGTQVAGPMQNQQPKYDMGEFAGVDQAIAKQQGQQPQVSTVPGTNGTVQETPGAATTLSQNTVPFTQALTDSQGDQKRMWDIYNNSQYSNEQRQIAGAQLSDMMRQEYEKNKATQFIRTATPEDLNKMLAGRSSEGSWAKAIMYGLLGMEASAKDEAAKLGVGAKWQSQTIMNSDGTSSNVLYKMRADGLPMEGYNAETGQQLGSKELAKLIAGGQKLDMVGGTYVNDRTGEVGRVVSDKTTGQSWIQTDKGRRPMGGFRPQSSMGTLDDMRARKIQEVNIALQGKTQEEKMRILRDYNSKLVGAGYQAIQPNEVGLTAPQIGGGAPAPAATGTPAPAAGQVKKPVPPVPLDQQATIAPKPSPFSSVNPSATAATGTRPTLSQLEAQKTKEKEAAQEEGTDLGKLKVNQGKNENNADYLITKVAELTTHPGFETSVGAKGPTMAFGMMDKPISGTDAADWHARFSEVQGQSFLTAIENLRGMGALSDQEGKSATQAIKRMATTQSESEFKQASKEFQDIIKRGIDNSRSKLGQQPKYNIEAESEMAKKRQQGQGQWRVINVQPGQ